MMRSVCRRFPADVAAVGVVLSVGVFFSVACRKTQPVGDPAGGVGFEPAGIDLGERVWGASVPVEAAFVNHSDRPVRVVEADSSCDCTVLEMDIGRGRTLGPGEALAIRASVDVGTRERTRTSTISIVLESRRAYRLPIRFRVRATWRLEPDLRALDFGRVVLGAADASPIERRMRFESQSDRLLGAESRDADWLDCAVTNEDESPGVIRVRVLRDRLRVGMQRGIVTIKTDSAVVPERTIVVSAAALRALLPTPEPVFAAPGKPVTVRFRDPSGAAVRLVDADTNDATLLARLSEEGDVIIEARGAVVSDEPLRLEVRAADGRRGWVDVYVGVGP